MMKNSFNVAIYDSHSMMIRRRNKFRLLLSILLVAVAVAVAGYFMAPQIINWGSPQKNEEKVAPLPPAKVPQPIATKEQIIKTIPLPSK